MGRHAHKAASGCSISTNPESVLWTPGIEEIPQKKKKKKRFCSWRCIGNHSPSIYFLNSHIHISIFNVLTSLAVSNCLAYNWTLPKFIRSQVILPRNTFNIIHLFNTYLLNSYFVVGSMLSARDRSLSQKDNSCPHGANSLVKETVSQQIAVWFQIVKNAMKGKTRILWKDKRKNDLL